MHNVAITTIEQDGRTLLTITIDVSPQVIAESRPSSTGRTKLVASTRGFIDLPPDYELSMLLNVTTKAKKEKLK